MEYFYIANFILIKWFEYFLHKDRWQVKLIVKVTPWRKQIEWRKLIQELTHRHRLYLHTSHLVDIINESYVNHINYTWQNLFQAQSIS